VYPSHRTIAERSGMSVSSVRRGIEQLATAGYLILDRHGGGATCLYSFAVPKAPAVRSTLNELDTRERAPESDPSSFNSEREFVQMDDLDRSTLNNESERESEREAKGARSA